MDDLVKALGMSGVSKSQVSRLCAELDERVGAFLNRQIEGDWPYLWIDATYVKVRQAGRIVSILVNIGMWFERFVIVVGSLYQDFLPGNWGYYKPTWVDVCTYLGTFGLFFTMFLLFIRFLPLIATSEVKGVTPQAAIDRDHRSGDI